MMDSRIEMSDWSADEIILRHERELGELSRQMAELTRHITETHKAVRGMSRSLERLSRAFEVNTALAERRMAEAEAKTALALEATRHLAWLNRALGRFTDRLAFLIVAGLAAGAFIMLALIPFLRRL